MLRTPVLAELLLQRLLSIGPMPQPEAVTLLESRAPGRGEEVIAWARSAGMVRVAERDDGEPGPAMLEPVMPDRTPLAA